MNYEFKLYVITVFRHCVHVYEILALMDSYLSSQESEDLKLYLINF